MRGSGCDTNFIVFEIRTNNLDAAGSIIDAAVNAGANVVDLITFDASNREYYYRQALNTAIMNAIKKAESIAVNLGLPSRPILVNIVENTALAFPVQREFAATPIMPGAINIAASVTVDFVF